MTKGRWESLHLWQTRELDQNLYNLSNGIELVFCLYLSYDLNLFFLSPFVYIKYDKQSKRNGYLHWDFIFDFNAINIPTKTTTANKGCSICTHVSYKGETIDSIGKNPFEIIKGSIESESSIYIVREKLQISIVNCFLHSLNIKYNVESTLWDIYPYENGIKILF